VTDTESTAGHSDTRPGGEVLLRLSTEMVKLQKEYWGKGPESAKAYVMDDILLIAMRGGLTVAEKTMLKADRPDSVRATRQEFQNLMADRLTGMVEDVTGRKVLTYQSQVLFDPNLVVELFVFDKNAPAPARATAEGQLDDEPIGEVRGDDVEIAAPDNDGSRPQDD
jgi:uncharacterized protein YbcI